MPASAFVFTIRTGPVDPLDSVEANLGFRHVSTKGCCIRVPTADFADSFLHGREHVSCICAIDSRLLAQVCGYIFPRRAREVFCDFDLDVAEIAFPCDPFALLFGGIVGFGGTGRSAFKPTVPVVRYEGFPLVLLCRAVGVYIVDVRKIDLEPV